MYTICIFCSLWCSNCWFILWNICYFGRIPGIFSYYDSSYTPHIYNYHADCCNSDAMWSYWHYANFVRTLPFNFKCLLKISLGGYNDKMRVLLNAILVQIVNFEVKPNRFSALMVRWILLLSFLFPFIIFLSHI